ncbi:MAG: Ig-like domain-containing protein [Erysipelotrichaceae bacterium]|jgi:uncharacterized protein YjdB|nr:Ig-like domain-containing protein [Erysipelotrichaceae bacterium]
MKKKVVSFGILSIALLGSLIILKPGLKFFDSSRALKSGAYAYTLADSENFEGDRSGAASGTVYHGVFSQIGRISGEALVNTTNSMKIDNYTWAMRLNAANPLKETYLDVSGIDRVLLDYKLTTANTELIIEADTTYTVNRVSAAITELEIICYTVDVVTIKLQRVGGIAPTGNMDAGFDNFRFYACSIPEPVAVESVQISGPTSVYVGEQIELTAVVNPTNAPQEVVWATSNSAIATVSDGYVVGVAEGSVTITATSVSDNTVTGTYEIEVHAAGAPVLYIDGATSVYVDSEITLTAAITPATLPQAVNWESSNASIATISSSGVVRGISEGSVTITATSQTNSAITGTHTLNVLPPSTRTPQIVSTLTISGGANSYVKNGAGTMNNGATFIITAGTTQGTMGANSGNFANIGTLASIEGGATLGVSGDPLAAAMTISPGANTIDPIYNANMKFGSDSVDAARVASLHFQALVNGTWVNVASQTGNTGVATNATLSLTATNADNVVGATSVRLVVIFTAVTDGNTRVNIDGFDIIALA